MFSVDVTAPVAALTPLQLNPATGKTLRKSHRWFCKLISRTNQAAIMWLVWSNMAVADTVYSDYDAYYGSLKNGLFNEAGKHAFTTTGQYKSTWEGGVGRKIYRITLAGNSLILNGRKLRLNSALRFPGEKADDGIGLVGDVLYVSFTYACIEAQYPAASGMAARHRSVYLLKLPSIAGHSSSKPALYLLPSLFGSCLAIRRDDNGRVSVDKVVYRFEAQDTPIGIDFVEYKLDQAMFLPTGTKVSATFIEADNVYKFSVKE